MLNWIKKKLNKKAILSEIVTHETTNKNRTAYDFGAHASIRERMERAGYVYVGSSGGADATDPKAYRP